MTDGASSGGASGSGRPLYLLVGAVGAGKGTQAQILQDRMGLPHLASGDLFRTATREGTPLGEKAKSYMERGELVPDDITIDMFMEELGRPGASRGAILDGFPRTVAQATALDDIMNGRGPLVVIDIVVPEDVLLRRLAARRICGDCGINAPIEWITACGECGGALVHRTDDSDGIVAGRLQVYHRQTRPIVEFYSSRPTFRTIDGNLPPDVVTASMDKAIREASVVTGGVR